MDSPENVVALPANLAAYVAQGPVPILPFHRGSHPQYSAKVDTALAMVATTNATGARLRTLLLTEENALRLDIANVARRGRLQ